METKQMTILEQAMTYHVNGYNLIPILKNKKPALKEVIPQRTADQTDEQILEWFGKENPPNIGIITGEKSNLIVVDVDLYHGAKDIFPETFTVKTGNGGLQKYYQFTPGFSISANGYPSMPFVDIRGTGGYVVAPPSITDYIDDKTGKRMGGKYEIINNIPLAPFPVNLFPKQKPKKTFNELTTASKGNRDDSLTSVVGRLLQLENDEALWTIEVLPAVERINEGYSPPLSKADVLKVFNSIAKKEHERRQGLILSPFQMDDGEVIKNVKIPIRKNGNAIIKDMANVVIVLEHHPYYKGTIKYNTFKQEIEYNRKAIDDSDITKIQHFLQTETSLTGIQQNTVYSGIVHVAQQHKYDEAKDWLTSLVWDQVPRLSTWLSSSLGVTDNDYHRGIGSQWINGMVNRIMRPGAQFDYVLMLVGPQNLGKTSFFRIIGGNFYKSYTGAVENKDFYLALRGAILVDLDEGATLYKSEAIKIKSIITEVCDEYRAPYDRIMKKYPRRFVFSMSTNDNEPFRDATGNRRYWTIDIDKIVNFKWLEDNREQIFAEAYHYWKNKLELPQVPFGEAADIQEAHLPDDSWTELVCEEVRKSAEYCEGNPNYSTTVIDVFHSVFKDESLVRLDRRHEQRIGTIFRKQLGLEKRREMIDGERKNRWYISEKKLKELQTKNAKKIVPEVDKLAEDLKDDETISTSGEIPF